MAKRGGKPIDASAWFRSLPPERQESLRERYLGHFGPPARGAKKRAAAKTKPAPKKKVTKTKRVAKKAVAGRAR